VSFLKFGYVNYNPDTKVVRFIRGLKEGKLLMTVCRKCGKPYFPPRTECSNCLSVDDVEWREISGRCKLLTYSISHFAPAGFEAIVPYRLAVAQLEEGPRVLAHISKEVKDEEIKIGMDLKLVVKELPQNRLVYEFTKP
jgi:uncharacterized OB-fold protein